MAKTPNIISAGDDSSISLSVIYTFHMRKFFMRSFSSGVISCSSCVVRLDSHGRKPFKKAMSATTANTTASISPTTMPTMSPNINCILTSIRATGVEPAQPCGHGNLNPARIPIPPSPQCSTLLAGLHAILEDANLDIWQLPKSRELGSSS